jgi:hypothetical protein
MSLLRKMTAGFFILSYGIMTTGIATAAEKDSILLYTPFTKISVPPESQLTMPLM